MEGQPEHRGMANDGPVFRRKRVDRRHRRRFGGIGQIGDAARVDHLLQEVAQELRIAAGARGHDLEHMRGHRSLLGRQLGQPQRILRSERLQLDANHGLSLRRHESFGALARHREEPRVGSDLADQVRQQLGGSAVHVVRVLDLDQLRLGHDRREKSCDRFVYLRAPVGLGQHRDLGRGRDLESERNGDQRQPGREIGGAFLEFFFQTLGDDQLGIVTPEFHVFPQQLAPHRVRRGGGIRFAGGVLLVEPGRRVAQRLEQAGLTDSGVASHFDQPARPRARAGEGFADDAQLGIAAGERQALRQYLSRLRALRAADRPRLNRLRLSFHYERLELGRFELRRRTLEHVARRVDFARLGFRHQPRGQVHGVAHDRIGAAIFRPDVAGENGAAMHADADRKWQIARRDPCQRQQHALFVVASDLRRSTSQDELSPVRVDVRSEE